MTDAIETMRGILIKNIKAYEPSIYAECAQVSRQPPLRIPLSCELVPRRCSPPLQARKIGNKIAASWKLDLDLQRGLDWLFCARSPSDTISSALAGFPAHGVFRLNRPFTVDSGLYKELGACSGRVYNQRLQPRKAARSHLSHPIRETNHENSPCRLFRGRGLAREPYLVSSTCPDLSGAEIINGRIIPPSLQAVAVDMATAGAATVVAGPWPVRT